MEVLEKLGKNSQTAAQKLSVRSALNPMLWLSAVNMPTCFLFAYLLSNFPVALTFLLIIGITPMMVTCFGFCYFVLKRPEKLQSEDYQIHHQTLQMVNEKSTRFDTKTTLSVLSGIAQSQQIKQLDAGEKENEF